MSSCSTSSTSKSPCMYIYRGYTYRAILEFSIRARQGTSERYSREERRQVRIVIDIRIYPSMDQPPIAGGKATGRGMRSIAKAHTITCVYRCARFTRGCNRRCNRHPTRVAPCVHTRDCLMRNMLSGDRILRHEFCMKAYCCTFIPSIIMAKV